MCDQMQGTFYECATLKGADLEVIAKEERLHLPWIKQIKRLCTQSTGFNM